MIEDPQFVDQMSDWHLKSGSSALESGVQVSFAGFSGETIDVSKDKNGATRTAPWSLGIYARASDLNPPLSPTGLVIK